jgi:NADH-quinone oxidoreductase subunit L
MVTAGVYLVARCHVLFANAPDIASLTALLGVATLLMAGVIAVVQTDIKRIIAYSTMSRAVNSRTRAHSRPSSRAK